LRILFAIAEAYPFVKVGGLADVGGALPKRLAASGHDVRLILPGYPSANHLGPETAVCHLRVPMGPREERVEVAHHGSHRGVEVYTVCNDHYFHEGMICGGYAHGDVIPYVLFSKAIAAFAALTGGGTGWRPDVVHCNDWHTGLVPAYARAGPAREVLARTGFVFSIHNLAYQGRVGVEAEVGHGYLVHARVHPGCFHLLVSCGPTDIEHRGELLRRGREALSRRVPVSGGGGPSEPERREHG
jgi:starch synthase